jgi:hypothetical protein
MSARVGLECLHAFISGNVRRAFGEVPAPILSSALITKHGARLTGPVVEVTWPSTSAFLATDGVADELLEALLDEHEGR